MLQCGTLQASEKIQYDGISLWITSFLKSKLTFLTIVFRKLETKFFKEIK
jgi:hypothetical protein